MIDVKRTMTSHP